MAHRDLLIVKENDEAFQCVQAIDSLPIVKFWTRNGVRHPNSFWLPTASDKFYSDFVALLDDGRMLVVECKGAHLADGADTNEKRLVGELWERQSQGRGRFIVVEKSVAGQDMRGQIMNKIGA
jgi:type III restriction enzyme